MDKHYHESQYVNGFLTKFCKLCGKDITDEIHIREEDDD